MTGKVDRDGGFHRQEQQNQLLQLCTARIVWSDAVIRPARFGPFRHRQTTYDCTVMKEDTGVIRGLPIDGDQ